MLDEDYLDRHQKNYARHHHYGKSDGRRNVVKEASMTDD
jgi:hypothetical protein